MAQGGTLRDTSSDRARTLGLALRALRDRSTCPGNTYLETCASLADWSPTPVRRLNKGRGTFILANSRYPCLQWGVCGQISLVELVAEGTLRDSTLDCFPDVFTHVLVLVARVSHLISNTTHNN